MDAFEIGFQFNEDFLFRNMNTLHLMNYYIIAKPQNDEPVVHSDETIGEIKLAETCSQSLLSDFTKLKFSLTPKVAQKRASTFNLQSPKVKKQPNFSGSLAPKTDSDVGASAGMQPKTQMFAECVINGQKTYMCTLCTYKTTYNSAIHRHGRSAHGENLPSYKCGSCNFASPEKSRLKNHYMKSHNLTEVVAKGAVEATPLE